MHFRLNYLSQFGFFKIRTKLTQDVLFATKDSISNVPTNTVKLSTQIQRYGILERSSFIEIYWSLVSQAHFVTPNIFIFQSYYSLDADRFGVYFERGKQCYWLHALHKFHLSAQITFSQKCSPLNRRTQTDKLPLLRRARIESGQRLDVGSISECRIVWKQNCDHQ